MKKENLDKLLFELIRNSKRSDRELAKSLGFSQPTVTRLRKTLEKEAIAQYTVIPNSAYLGFDILAFALVRTKVYLQPFWEHRDKWVQGHPNVMFFGTGEGIDSDALIVSIHKDYSDFARFYQRFRADCAEYCEDFKTFIVSLKGSVQIKHFTFDHLADACQRKPEQ